MQEIKTNTENNAPQFESVETINVMDVYKKGVELHSMPALEKKTFKDGTESEVLFLPKGFYPEHPEVYFAFISPRAQELQRTATGVKPTDEFPKNTKLTLQRNLKTGQYLAVVTLKGIQRTATAVAAAEADWA